jgi:glyoxylase-like metal-dependent hydrolase (beta-lactamase superfamily II)
MPFLTEPVPARGVALPVLPGIFRVVATNPGPMTYHGTNTYLIAVEKGFDVVDPGPDDAGHVAAILAATGGRVERIVVTHTHLDHVGALPALRDATKAPVFAFAPSALADLRPDVPLADGENMRAFACIHTPGHATDHLCYARDDGVVFSGDHVMSWSTTVVSPSGGGMTDYFASLRRLLARDDRIFLPGHGPPLPEPGKLVAELLEHRLRREAAIAAALGPNPRAPADLIDTVYGPIAEALRAPAERSVLAHLLKLEDDGRATRDGDLWRVA